MSVNTEELEARVRNLEFALMSVVAVFSQGEMIEERIGILMNQFIGTNEDLESLLGFKDVKNLGSK